MRGFLTFAAIFGVSTPFIIAGAALVVALIILFVALFLFRNSGKKKAGAANAAGASDWQRQQGQQGAQGAWGQQSAGWGANAAQQQPGGWGTPAQQTPGSAGAAGWGSPAAAQPQQSGWGANAQQQQSGWGSPNDAQQQPSGWGTPASAQQQQPAGWGTPASAQQPAGWGTQQPAGWDANPAQQPAGWGTPASAQQQQPAGWGTQQPQQSGWGNQAQQAWDQTAPPAADPWAQPQAAPSWGSPANQQQPPSVYSGSGSGQSWGQSAQSVDQWGQPIQQQAQQAGWPGSASQPSGGNAPAPSWQQQGQGFGQSQPAFGASENPDGDRTILRPSGAPAANSQGRLGIVRIEEGKEPGRVYEMRKESLSIGRSRESDIFLEDLAVSRLHASIISMGSGNYALRDEGSANGTKVNGQTVNKYQPYPLQEGDKIQLGQTVLVFARR